VRSQGAGSLLGVEAVVLETGGSVSVITEASLQSDPAALRRVRGFSQES